MFLTPTITQAVLHVYKELTFINAVFPGRLLSVGHNTPYDNNVCYTFQLPVPSNNEKMVRFYGAFALNRRKGIPAPFPIYCYPDGLVPTHIKLVVVLEAQYRNVSPTLYDCIPNDIPPHLGRRFDEVYLNNMYNQLRLWSIAGHAPPPAVRLDP